MGSDPGNKGSTVVPGQCKQFDFKKVQCLGSDWIRVHSPIRIRVLKVWIRPLINLWDLNDGFDKVLKEPDQKGQC